MNPAFLTGSLVLLAIGGALSLRGVEVGGNLEMPGYVAANWDEVDGLPENSVTSLTQTPDGYLWMGTFNGLVRFNGTEFVVFTPSNTPELPSGGIVNLHSDRHGRLWISTYGGLVVRDGDGWHPRQPGDDWKGDFVRTFTERANGDLLITSFHGKVTEYADGRFSALPAHPGKPDEGCFGGVDDDGHWWLVQKEFAGRWENGRWVARLGCSSEVAKDAVGCAPARDGGIWVLLGRELRRFRLGVEEAHITLPEPPGGVWSLTEDHQGRVWIATYNRGFCRVSADGTMQRWDATRGLSNSGRCVYEDRERNLWLGSSGDGLTRLTQRRVQHFGFPPEGGQAVTHSVWPELGGGLLVATYGAGLFHLTETGATHRVLPGASPSPFLQSVLRDRSGRLWIGTLGRQLLLTEEDEAPELPEASTAARNVVAIFEDSSGQVWFGWGGGEIGMFDGRDYCRFGYRQGTAQGSNSECFAEHASGEIWVSNGSGVFRLEGGQRFIEVKSAAGETIPQIECLLAESDGSMWMGSSDRGLIRMKDGELVALGVEVGLPKGGIQGLVRDDHGFLWMAWGQDLVRASLRDLHAVADGAKGRLACLMLDANDGLLHNAAFTGGRQPTCVKDQKGRLWFAMTKGVVMIDPSAIRFNTVPPPVHIERVSFLAREAATQGNLPSNRRVTVEAPMQRRSPGANAVLPPGSRNIEIQYVGLSFTAPDKVSYRIKLEGLDQNWTDFGTRRTVFYPALPPGDYTFRVTACNNDGVWSDWDTSLAFLVQPYYWQTWWFSPLVVATLLGLASAALWWRFRTHTQRVLERERTAKEISRLAGRLLHAQEDERRRIARELHDHFSQQLALLSVDMDLLQQTSPGEGQSDKGRLKEMTARVKELSSEVHRMAHELHPAKLDQLGLVTAARAFCRSFADTQGLKITFGETGFPCSIPGEVALCCYRVMQEALQNVLHHSGAGNASVALRAEPNRVCLTVTDPGKGFDLEQARQKGGLGLSSMEERVRHARGKLTLRSAPGEGTRVEVCLPLNPAAPAS